MNGSLLRIRIPFFTSTDLNHGQSPDPGHSDFSVYSSGWAELKFGLRTVAADAGLSDDDDDIDESALPGFSHPTMRPSTPPLNKGKSREPEQLALPVGPAPSNQLSGNIGTPIGSASRGARQNLGGIQVESRSRVHASSIPRRETNPLLGPAGLILSTNRSSLPS